MLINYAEETKEAEECITKAKELKKQKLLRIGARQIFASFL